MTNPMDEPDRVPIRAKGMIRGSRRRFHVAVYEDTYQRLLQLLRPRESMENVVKRLLDNEDGTAGKQ